MSNPAFAACTYQGMAVRRTHSPGAPGFALALLAVLMVLALAARAAHAAELERFLKATQPADIFPGADRLAPPGGSPHDYVLNDAAQSMQADMQHGSGDAHHASHTKSGMPMQNGHDHGQDHGNTKVVK